MELPWPLPLMQAPIGPAATPELVVAVSETGALGTLAASWTEPEPLRVQLRRIRSADAPRFCVNLALAFEQEERLRVALEEGIGFVSFSWGVDAELIRATHEAGAIALVQASAVADAVRAEAAGADVVIVQGFEAGGHVNGATPLLDLIGAVRSRVRLPLLAAGGIGDAAAARRAREAGADGIACGTAFLAADEADVHPRYLERLLRAEAADTVVTSLFDRGWPNVEHRVIRNDAVALWEAAGRPASGKRPREGELVATREGVRMTRYSFAQPTRATSGEIDSMAMYAGTSVAGVTGREPAAAIVRRLAAAFA